MRNATYVAAIALILFAAPSANAFNPQPEPPAKAKLEKVQPGDPVSKKGNKAIIDDNRKTLNKGLEQNKKK